MKIGIFTYHHADNYGAYLQACAICNRLNEHPDLEVEIIDFVMNKEIEFYSFYEKKWVKLLGIFAKKIGFRCKIHQVFEKARLSPVMRLSRESLRSDSINDFIKFVQGKYDVIIAGSDEIWKLDGFRGYPTPYWLFGDLKCRKFSYAASSRADFSKLKGEKRETLVKNLHEFEYIGVREQQTAESLKELLGENKKICVCCDPTFLYDFPLRDLSLEEALKGKAKIDPKKKTIVLMTMDHKIATRVRETFGKEYNLVSVLEYHSGYRNVYDLTPLQWLEVVKNADLFITTFFHGTCFSIIYQTPFITFGSKERNSKIKSLFVGAEELKERYILDKDDFLDRPDFKEEVVKRMKKFDTTEYIRVRRENFNDFVDVLVDSRNMALK